MGDVTQGKCGYRGCSNRAYSRLWAWLTVDGHDFQTVLCSKHAAEFKVRLGGDHIPQRKQDAA